MIFALAAWAVIQVLALFALRQWSRLPHKPDNVVHLGTYRARRAS